MKIAIVGSVGIPGRYGGFETLAENLARQQRMVARDVELTVYCSAAPDASRPSHYLGARLRYCRLKANGIQSTLYDAVTLFDAARRKSDVALLLGVSGAIAIPFIRLLSSMRIVTNVDGIEWRRDKWKGLARQFLRLSEWLAVRFSHEVLADNKGIADHLRAAYGVDAKVIAYGGDHALEGADVPSDLATEFDLPEGYALAICRIESENNVDMILEAFASAGRSLVFVGNWSNSAYGRALRQRHGGSECLRLIDPVYDAAVLHRLRAGAALYVHGHSAGGTNPSLVEMMHFGLPVLAYDCVYNRHTTENRAAYFNSARELTELAVSGWVSGAGDALREVARRRYSWDRIARDYFELLGASAVKSSCPASSCSREAAE